jgi:hypothetical protein
LQAKVEMLTLEPRRKGSGKSLIVFPQPCGCQPYLTPSHLPDFQVWGVGDGTHGRVGSTLQVHLFWKNRILNAALSGWCGVPSAGTQAR